MIDSFKHHFQDVLPQKASDVSGVVKNRGAAVVSGPRVPVRGVVNMSETAHTSSTLWWMTSWSTASSYTESPSSSLSTSTGRCSHGMSVAMPPNRSTSLTASITAVTPSALDIFTSTPGVWAYEHRRQLNTVDCWWNSWWPHKEQWHIVWMKNLITGLDFQLYKVTQGQHQSTILSSHVLLLQGLLDPLVWSYQQGLYRVLVSLPGSLQQLCLQRHMGPWHPPHNLFPLLRRALVERRASAAVTRCHICSGYQQQRDHLLTTCTENKQLNFTTAAVAHTYLSGVFSTGFDEGRGPSLFLSDLVIISDGELQSLRPLRQDTFILFLLLCSPFPLALHDLKPSLSALNNMEKKSESFSPKWFKHAQWLINYPVFTQHSTSLLLQSDYRAAGRLNWLVVLEQRG